MAKRVATEPAVLFELVDGGRIAVVTLNRPRRLNAYDVTMRDALYEALTAVRDDPGVRAMILCGNGPAFSTGGDVAEFGSAPSPTRAREVRWLRDVWGTLWNLPQVTIAAVHGYAVGGGWEMALLCDQCVAATDARFALPETSLAMIPGVAGTQTLPRLAGLERGMHHVLTGAWLDAGAAQAMGLVSRVVPRARLRAAALRLARQVARLDATLVRRLKRAVNDGLDLPLASALRLEARFSVVTERTA
ncbi:MAG: enoyl-CoA hydratase/isomerase family protein [Deltaproteobacteria bacterium]|nr:enoyl-CoA hydratase/isomerase family protein [Deltaproteobacteria bacterium]